MKRRTFLRGAAAAAAVAPFAGCTRSEHPAPTLETSDSYDFDLDEATISDLVASMEQGRHSARSLCELYLDRVNAVDRNGPELRSVIELNPDALSIADRLDEERKSGVIRGVLHGIPVMIKDNIDTADRMVTSAGSLALDNNLAARDAFIVGRLREAGAVILAKTNLSEWANFRSTRSSSGWSGRGGQVRNPYVLDRSPCGSSSGSAVAVAANLCAAAVGTETDGSVICPSSANGIVGIKPTLGLLSRSGIIPIAHSQDTAGPMARTVTDAAILLSAMASVDDRDVATKGQQRHDDYTSFLDAAGLKGKRIGVARNFLGFHEKVDALITSVVEVLESAGATVVDPADIATKGEYGDAEYEVLLYEFKSDLNKYLQGTASDVPVRNLEELIEFNEANRADEMPFFEQEIFVAAQEKGPLSDRAYIDALAKCRRLTRDEGIDATLKLHDLDAILAASGGPAWCIDVVTGDHFLGGSSSPAAVSGYPNITVPAGSVHGLPVGVSFFGPAYSESTLIQIAYAYEQSSRHRTNPLFRLSVV